MASVFKRGGKKNRGGSYYVSWNNHTGQRQTKSAKTTDKATAERLLLPLQRLQGDPHEWTEKPTKSCRVAKPAGTSRRLGPNTWDRIRTKLKNRSNG